jgi:transposase
MLSSLSAEELIPADHPIRRIRKVVDVVLAELDGEFDAMYATSGRPSVPPETLLKATVLMALYSIRSERAFCERLNYDLLFKWFLDLPIDARSFDATTFSKNRQRLLSHEIADRFFVAVVKQAQLRRYVSSEHFSVDGTRLEAWASHKSFQPKATSKRKPPKGRNDEVSYHGERRSNETHLMERRDALLVDIELTEASGYAELDAALEMLGRLPAARRRRTVAADKAYDTVGWVADVRDLGFTPHVAPNTTNRRSAIDGRTTRHAGHR